MKKKELLTVKELAAAELRMSLKSIQRAYRKGEIPVQWLGRLARFDLTQVQRAMARNGKIRMLRLNSNSTLRRAVKKSPRAVKRGRSWQMVCQEIFINEPGF